MARAGNSLGVGRKSKRAWTRRKAHKSNVPEDTPTELEWARMDKYSAVAGGWNADTDSDSDSDISGSTGSSSSFSPEIMELRKGDDVIMLCGDKAKTDDVWIGKIDSIRARAEHDVWVRIGWYWASLDIAEYIKSFESTTFAPLERASSDNFDFVPVEDCIRATHVYEYDESDLEPPDLEPTSYFVRSHLWYKRRHLEPKPGALSCICFRAYNPFPKVLLESLLDEDIMHFCPRSSCRRWYHRNCLLAQGSVDHPYSNYRGDRGVRLLSVNPDDSAPCALLAWYCEPLAPSDPEYSMSLDPVDLRSAISGNDHISLAHLPPALVRVAQFPIVRRPGPRHACWSAVGNVTEVTLARRFIYAAFEGLYPGGRQYAEVEELVKQAGELEHRVRGLDVDMVRDGEDQSLVKQENTLLDDLLELIKSLDTYTFLASPYSPYWAARELQLDEDVEAMAAPPLVCPNPDCNNAI
ncbi:hypothetical protein OBBRIDRAFT_796893 [Obba rivulosa]|uniref:BAH domain-containing protein n=1 Tax=Obba rivulosa TaxID=1052685 RepID=A0A8E2ARC9_9APHY|nr:hypothetical protein OBBRIDRAFT_796893 [Obba rivulosa]